MPDVDTDTSTVDRASSRRTADHLPDPTVTSSTRRASPVRGTLRSSTRVSTVVSSGLVSALVALVLMALILVSLPLMSPAWGAVQTPTDADDVELTIEVPEAA